METKYQSNDEVTQTEFVLNDAGQADLFLADTQQYKTLLGLAGEQAGKTSVGVLWLRKEVDAYWDVGPFNYIVGANTYKVLKQSTKEKFDEVFTSYMGSYNHKEDYFQLRKEGKDWGKIYFRSQGMDKKSAGDSFIGIPDCRAGLGDEIAKWQRQFYIRFRGRLGRLNGPFFGCGTPYALNFIKKEIVDRADTDPTVIYRRWTCMDNPSYDKAGIETLRRTLTKTEFDRLVLGILTKAQGLVHQAWSPDHYTKEVPRGTPTYIAGVDWGYDHPMAIIILGVYNQNLAIIESVTKLQHLGPDQVKQLILAKHALYKPVLWSAGHDQPGMIADLSANQTYPIPIQKYFETLPNYREVNVGNQKVSELIQTHKLKFLEGIEGKEDFDDEIETYKWDRLTEEDARDKPVDFNDDLMAALRYAVIGGLSMGMFREKIEKIVDTRDQTRKDIFKPKKKLHDWTDS